MQGSSLFLSLRRTSLVLAAVACWFSLGSPARATMVIPPDFATMVASAEVIFRGEVTSTRSEWNGTAPKRSIVTFVTFKVLETIKGTATDPYELRVLGGTVDGKTLKVTGVPTFKVGDRTLLFVEHNGTQFFPLVGIMHGYFRLVKDSTSGSEVVIRHDGSNLSSVSQIDQAHATAVAPATAAPRSLSAASTTTADLPMKVEDFEAQIRKQMIAPK